jgi:GNAT superfamily N-acetyltransferase
MDIFIRRANVEDCPRLLALVRELAIYENAQDEVTVSLAHFEESGFGDNPVWWGFVAEVNGIIEGFALCYVRFSTWKGQRLYLEDFYVTEKMRGNGIGKLIFEKVVEEMKVKGFNGMVWQVLEWNESAINFYNKYNTQFDKGWINCQLMA